MRKIKFRGMRPEGGWEFGFLSIGLDSFFIEDRNECPPTMSDPCGDAIVTRERIKHETVWQFTGMKDTNGADVYDGDILKFSYGIPPTSATILVEWKDGYDGGESYCGWWFAGLNGDASGPAGSCYEDDIEIIGNRHENPELIEGEQ